MKLVLPLLLLFAATAAPVAAQEPSETLETSTARASLLMQTCDLLFKTIATFQQSIDGCNQQVLILEKHAAQDTPEQRGIVLAAATHIDANIAEMYIRRKEPDLPFGCAIITRGLKRFAKHPEIFPDVAGMGAIISKAQGRLERVSSRCSFESFKAHNAIMRGAYGGKMQGARGDCYPSKSHIPEFYRICATALDEVTEVFGSIAEPTPLDLNFYLTLNLQITQSLFKTAEDNGKFATVVCKILPKSAPLAETSIYPMSGMAAYTLKTTKAAFDDYEKRCAKVK